MDIPFPLKQALENGTCVLFVGAGMGFHMTDGEGNTIPDATRLAKLLAEKFEVPSNGNYDLTKISQYVEVKKREEKNWSHLYKNAWLKQPLISI